MKVLTTVSLVEDWKKVLRKAWSIKFIFIAGFFSGLEFVLPFLDELFHPPRGLFAIFAFVATNAAFVTRIMAQKDPNEKA